MSRASPVLLAALLAAAALPSCDILREEPFELESWEPGSDYAGDGSDAAVSLTFSTDSDRPSVENAFSATEDGSPVRGSFAWKGRTLVFSPYAPLRPNREYRIIVEEGARDEEGVSLDGAVELVFWTRASGSGAGDRGSVLSFSPADGETVSDPRSPVVLTFSRPVAAADCRDYVSISPSAAGSWSVDGGGPSGTVARFTPVADWEEGKEYAVEVSDDMVDAERVRFGRSASSRFVRGTDAAAPALAGVDTLDGAGAAVAEASASAENALWERPYRLSLRFSEPVDLASLDSRVTCEPGVSLERETTGASAATVVYRTTELPAWGSRFALRIAEGYRDAAGNAGKAAGPYRFVFDGPASRPPRFVGIRLPLAPGGADEAAKLLTAYGVADAFAAIDVQAGAGRYPTDVATATVIEVYVELAQGATVDPFSAMEKFRLEATNGALSFSARRVRADAFAYPTPHAPWAAYARFQVEGYLTNRTSAGVVTFTVESGFADSAGNPTPAAAALPLLK